MTDYEFGDIVLIPFPFTDQTTTKKRPAVVVSSNAYHLSRPDIVLMAVTSRIKPDAVFGDAPIDHWEEAGLIKPSVIKPVLATVEKSLIIRKMGSLHNDDRQSLKKYLESILG
ncbi:MAG: type II toxin-antitoxin system PemK/MazF family toxin [Deltaproteobacteria bacterium]|nr:type II toxin-antitoxin system PemK/MazF family toxin [Deltaproteobacteria bacterium]